MNVTRRRLLAAATAAPMLHPFADARAIARIPGARRTWSMGFSPFPPRLTTETLIQGIDLGSSRADYAAIHEELPWADLLDGMSPDAILDREKLGLVAYLRSKGLRLYFMADANDGLSRGEDAPTLRARGRSLVEPAVQQLYRSYVSA